MSSIQEYFLQALRPFLPSGAEVISAVSKTQTSTEITVKLGENLQTATMDKVDIKHYLGGRTPEINAQEGEPLSDVLERFSKKYRLFISPGEDYRPDDAVVAFNELPSIDKEIVLLPSSISLYGAVTLRIINQPNELEKSLPPACQFGHHRRLLGLSSHIFEAKEDPQLNVSDSLANAVVDRLTELGLVGDLTVERLKGADIGGVLNDGVSNIVLLKDEEGVVWPIRYRLPE